MTCDLCLSSAEFICPVVFRLMSKGNLCVIKAIEYNNTWFIRSKTAPMFILYINIAQTCLAPTTLLVI